MMYMDTMHELHLRSLDLNLILALDALLEERNVTRAAHRVGITQSAMSHALARLRAVTGDALLVRTANGMVATARAEELGPPIRRALEGVATALRPPQTFDPKTAERRIRIGTGDYGEIVLLPRVIERLAKEAPRVDLRVVFQAEDAARMLRSGDVDLLLSPVFAAEVGPGMYARKLFDERFVCVVRRGHQLARKKLTLARYVAASHALISPRGKEGSQTDEALARLGLSRRVAVTVPHFLVAPHIVAQSDLVLTLAARVANMLAAPLGLVILEPPSELRLAGFTMSAVWHERTHADPAQRWTREVFAEVAKHS
jgi:DNA-binding transcriptional LysR family regulator